MQLTRHIAKAAWSTADKFLYLLLGLVYILPQKVIGETQYGLFMFAQGILTVVYMLSDGFALQVIVNFGVVEENRPQALSFAAAMHAVFIAVCTGIIWFGRDIIAVDIAGKPDFAPVLALFPIVALGFLLRNFTLKIAQLRLDTRRVFFIDAAWIGAMVLLFIYGWQTGALATAQDMMLITAAGAAASSAVGLLLCWRDLRFARTFDRGLLRRMTRFGIGQFGSAATLALQSQGDLLILGPLVSSATLANYDVAKKFFRGFEGIRDAGSLFVYPAVAKLSAERRHGELTVLVEKMIAFTAIVIAPLVLLIWLGPVDALFELIYKGDYRQAPDLFRILSIAALAIPLGMNAFVLNGMSRVRRLFTITSISVILFFITAVILVPKLEATGQAIATIVGYWALGILSLLAVRRITGVTPRGIISRWRDALDFVKKAWKAGLRRR